jgi:hypothetical protein
MASATGSAVGLRQASSVTCRAGPPDLQEVVLCACGLNE